MRVLCCGYSQRPTTPPCATLGNSRAAHDALTRLETFWPDLTWRFRNSGVRLSLSIYRGGIVPGNSASFGHVAVQNLQHRLQRGKFLGILTWRSLPPLAWL